MEDLTCTKCGGMLGENYVCPYCGTRFKPNTPQQQVNIIVVTTEEPEDVPSESEEPDDVPTEPANKSFVLYMCALIGIPVLLYNWRASGNDWFAVGALGAGVLVYFISHFFKER